MIGRDETSRNDARLERPSGTPAPPRGARLRRTFAAVVRPCARALRSWLDSWSGIGHVAVGMPRQGYDLQLTQYDDRGWRATFYTHGHGALADERDGHRVGAHASQSCFRSLR